LRSESETLRYSIALRMVVSMMTAPFERLKGGRKESADTGWRYPLHGSGLAANGLVRERFEKALYAKVGIPLQGELLAVEVEQGDIVAVHDGARELLDGHIVVAPIERVERELAAEGLH
jgi:hypothetical protein